MKKNCTSNISTDDIKGQLKLIIEKYILPKIPIGSSRNLGFSPNLDTRSQVNFSSKALKFVSKLIRLRKSLIIRILMPNLMQ